MHKSIATKKRFTGCKNNVLRQQNDSAKALTIEEQINKKEFEGKVGFEQLQAFSSSH